MERRELKHLLQSVRSDPGSMQADSVWVSQTREKLLSTVRAESATSPQPQGFDMYGLWQAIHILLPGRFFFTARAMLVVLLMIGLAVGSVSASQDSLPGDWLYPVRWTKEAADLVLAPNTETKVRRLLDQAGAHVDAIEKVKTQQQGIQVAAVVTKKIESVNQFLYTESESSAAPTIAKVVEQKTGQILTSVKQKEKTRVEHDEGTAGRGTGTPQLNAQVVATVVNRIEETNVKAVEALVAKEGAAEAVGVDVGKLVQTKLDTLSQDLSALQKEVTVVQGIVGTSTATGTTHTGASTSASTSVDIVPAPSGATSSILVTGAGSSTARIGEVTVSSSVSSLTPGQGIVGEVSEVQSKVKVAEEKLVTARTLAEANNLLGALEKVQEVYEANKETRQVIGEIKKTAQQLSQSTVNQAGESVRPSTVTSTSGGEAVPIVSSSPAPRTTGENTTGTSL